MEEAQLREKLEESNMEEALELLDDAEGGRLQVLELAPSLGLLRDEELNNALLYHLKQKGVEIEYVKEEDE
ncbi:hypothetical protein C6I21_02765 [Alkalicoccus urumqiensis]|uniref:RNA polymerase sigma factor 70 region 1.1 domain-containing protein n=2 Tax=Alkalicoccus urumqiensis TaxID=1548213 RepID=A0A2P6ML28_ALKUR|nr:hypothetical protein [Alkalicoccus urumqiensis]PRO66980.1 hypothetical protein C6I21_02765 [Alkalicoccus urumqiensis]